MAANEDRSDRTRDTGISHPAEPYDQPARPLRARKPVSASQSPEIKPRKTPLGGTLSEVQRLLNADPSNEWVDFRSRGRPISQREIALLLDAYDVHPTYIHRGRKTERGYRAVCRSLQALSSRISNSRACKRAQEERSAREAVKTAHGCTVGGAAQYRRRSRAERFTPQMTGSAAIAIEIHIVAEGHGPPVARQDVLRRPITPASANNLSANKINRAPN